MSATSIMQNLNRHAVHGQENGQEVFIEDWKDPDGRWYRLEYHCQPDGSNAIAYVLSNPWGSNAYTAGQSHMFSDGRICIGNASSYSLDYVVRRSRFWCTGYSYLREHGHTQATRDIPEW